MTRIMIHAGTHKTASTAIQRTLREVRGDLQAQGIHMPGLPDYKIKHSDFRHELGGKAGRPTPGIDSFLADIAKLGAQDSAIMTNETLIGADPARLKTALAPATNASVDIYFYVRPQIGLLTSLYLQSVKNGRVCDTPRAYMADKGESAAFDFGPSIEAYASVFGKDHVHVREFTRGGLKDDSIIADLWEFMNLPQDILPKALAVEEEANFTPKAEVAEVLRALGQFFRAQSGEDPRGAAGPAVFSFFQSLNSVAPELEGTAFRLPMDLQTELDAKYRPERAAFAERWFSKPPSAAWLSETLVAPSPLLDLPRAPLAAAIDLAVARLEAKGKAKAGLAVLLRAFLERLPMNGDKVAIAGLADWATTQTEPVPDFVTPSAAKAARKAEKQAKPAGADGAAGKTKAKTRPARTGKADAPARANKAGKVARAGKAEKPAKADRPGATPEQTARRAARRAAKRAATT